MRALQTVLTPLSILVLAGVLLFLHFAPAPTAPVQPTVNGVALGKSYAKTLAATYAEGWDLAAKTLEDGKSVADAQKALPGLVEGRPGQGVQGRGLAGFLARPARGDRAVRLIEAFPSRRPLAGLRQRSEGGAAKHPDSVPCPSLSRTPPPTPALPHKGGGSQIHPLPPLWGRVRVGGWGRAKEPRPSAYLHSGLGRGGSPSPPRPRHFTSPTHDSSRTFQPTRNIMKTDFANLGGWRYDPDEVGRTLAGMPRPLFAAAAPDLAGSGAGKTALLFKAFKDVNGGYLDYPAQTIGDCVSQGFGHGIDLLECVQIAIAKAPEDFKQTATEAVYGMARVDVGGQRGSYSDGAVGAWAAKAVSTLGTVSRDVVGPYDGNRAKEWGAKGVPQDVMAKAGAHKVKTASLVSTYAELEDALANGYPVTVCSNQGFSLTRDADGFCRAKGSWAHCMLIVGVRADGRDGACIFQSWGSDVPSGPLALDQPPNSFWAERSVVEDMLSMRDSWSLSSFEGYPSQTLPDHWSYEGFS